MSKTKPLNNVLLKGLSDSDNWTFTERWSSLADNKVITGCHRIVLVEAVEQQRKPNQFKEPKLKTNATIPSYVADQFSIDSATFVASEGETLTFPGTGTLVGVGDGKKGELTRSAMKSIAKSVAEVLKTTRSIKVSIEASHLTGDMDFNFFLAQLRVAAYVADQWKVCVDPEAKKTLQIFVDGKFDHKAVNELGNAVMLAIELTQSPPNFCNPIGFAEVAKKKCEALNLPSKVAYECLNFDAAWAMGMGSFCGVAQGMKDEPAFIHLSYKDGKANHRLALVGKGVCHDTGGYNVKSFATGMHEMHTDMGGAAITLSTFLLMVQKAPKDVEIDAFIPCVENLIDANAYLPGDYITAMNGMSIAVLNTDAEGRLVMNDAICWAQKIFSDRETEQGKTDVPKTIITSATLTGAQVVALTDQCGAFYSTKPEYTELVREADKRNWENVWEMPFLQCIDKRLDHPRADMANVATPAMQGGTLTAALFLKRFVTQENVEYMHFDVAGPVYKDGNATGFGPALYLDFLSSILKLN